MNYIETGRQFRLPVFYFCKYSNGTVCFEKMRGTSFCVFDDGITIFSEKITKNCGLEQNIY